MRMDFVVRSELFGYYTRLSLAVMARARPRIVRGFSGRLVGSTSFLHVVRFQSSTSLKIKKNIFPSLQQRRRFNSYSIILLIFFSSTVK